jgi:hypothetical protein
MVLKSSPKGEIIDLRCGGGGDGELSVVGEVSVVVVDILLEKYLASGTEEGLIVVVVVMFP